MTDTQDRPTTTSGPPPLPSDGEVKDTIRVVNDNAQRVFLWDYERDRGQLVTLYNKAMSSQWNSVTELDWSTPVDPEAGHRAGQLADHAAQQGCQARCPARR